MTNSSVIPHIPHVKTMTTSRSTFFALILVSFGIGLAFSSVIVTDDTVVKPGVIVTDDTIVLPGVIITNGTVVLPGIVLNDVQGWQVLGGNLVFDIDMA